jgi:hypothetical protein
MASDEVLDLVGAGGISPSYDLLNSQGKRADTTNAHFGVHFQTPRISVNYFE